MAKPIRDEVKLEDNPLWYKDAIMFELHVRAYHDSNGDGKGDFPGLTEKLDYLQDLGVTALWLLPFYPSPLKDDGYDIADYASINPSYGTLNDFKTFLKEAHRRGLRVITELVLNHTSDQHHWFQRARLAPPGSVWRDFYVWSDTPERYREARIIFKDFETSNWAWDPVAKAYYWHRFYAHQPDLNFANPAVRRAMLRLVDFWFKLGVDGLRLDAVPYLYEAEGTNCENLPETHAFLRELRRHIDERYKNRMLLAEANQWPENAVAYFGQGDECQMAFHFPIMPRLFMAIRMEDRFPIIDIMEQTPPPPENGQWALFLRNHDELTLEMVTDEERDYMYRVYANDPQMRINLGIRRRLAPLLGNDRRRIELMKGLLFSLPGTPVLYYGDEIGMGDNIYLGDRNGVRTPMQWSSDRNAGFSYANNQRLFLPVISDPEYHFAAVNVLAQQGNPFSLLWWMKRLISLRKRFKAFGRGSIEFLFPDNPKVLAFIRHFEEETILVVANLSRFAQYVELDLSAFRGQVPIELFSSAEFPPIGDLPYLLTLGAHAFYWFAIESQHGGRPVEALVPAQVELPLLSAAGPAWESLFRGKAKVALEKLLPGWMLSSRWFGGKARRVKACEIQEMIPLAINDRSAVLALVHIEYSDGDPETYVLPLACVAEDDAPDLLRDRPQALLARLELKDKGWRGVLYDAFIDGAFGMTLLEAMARRRCFKCAGGELAATPFRILKRAVQQHEHLPEPIPLRAEQSNTSLIFGDRLILKLFRRVEEGINPDLEVGRFLTESSDFHNIAPVAGTIEYRPTRGEPITLGLLHAFIPNQGDAWQYTLGLLGDYYERALTRPLDSEALPPMQDHPLDFLDRELPPLALEMLSPYLDTARLLGERIAELHRALATAHGNPAFAPEPFTLLYQRSLYQSMRNRAGQFFQLLRSRMGRLPRQVQEDAQHVLDLKPAILRRYRSIIERRIITQRIRIHGDLHLGQILFTGKDFVIIDFEGEPAQSMSERRFKRSPLRDVAGMLRSFHYAAHAGLRNEQGRGVSGSRDQSHLAPWADFWQVGVSAAFLGAYLKKADQAPFLPASREDLRLLLDVFLLEKAVYELRYELNNRPDWVKIPLQGILQLLRGVE